MNSPREGSNVKPFTPLPALRTIWERGKRGEGGVGSEEDIEVRGSEVGNK